MTIGSNRLLVVIGKNKDLATSAEKRFDSDEVVLKKGIREKEKVVENLTSSNSTASKYIISDIEKIDMELQKLNVQLLEIEDKKIHP